ncbi:MAG: hypothetical protein U1F67_01965 [Rubrivivax sp.]
MRRKQISGLLCVAASALIGACGDGEDAALAGGGGTTNTRAGWVQCASDGGTCEFEGTQKIRYGTLTRYFEQTRTARVRCDKSVFGDPAAQEPNKACWRSPVAAPPAATPSPAPAPSPTPTPSPSPSPSPAWAARYGQAFLAPRGSAFLHHRLTRFVLLPFLLAIPAFTLHQHIAFGSAFGEARLHSLFRPAEATRIRELRAQRLSGHLPEPASGAQFSNEDRLSHGRNLHRSIPVPSHECGCGAVLARISGADTDLGRQSLGGESD